MFDHAHNLWLHLAVELGLPLTVLITALMLYLVGGVLRARLGATLHTASRWRVSAGLRTVEPNQAVTAHAAACLLVLLLHSAVEHPLWFSYFFLPGAFMLACSVALGSGADQPVPLAPRGSERGHGS